MEQSPEIEGLIKRMEELTGYGREEILLQTIVANYPQSTSMIIEQLKREGESSIRHWVVLDKGHQQQFEQLCMKYKEYSPEQLLNALILFGSRL